MKNTHDGPHFGAVLMDNSSIGEAGSCIETGSWDEGARENFYHVLESLLIHDKIFIESTGLKNDEAAQTMKDACGKLQESITVTELDLDAMYDIIFDFYSYYPYFGDTDVEQQPKLKYSEFVFRRENLYPLFDGKRWGNLGRPAVLTVRTFMYFTISQYYGIAYEPSSFRVPLFLHLCKNRPAPERFALFAKKSLDAVEKLAKSNVELINRELGFDAFSISLPLFRNLANEKLRNPRDLLKWALDFREHSEVRRFRKWCSDLDRALYEGDSDKVNDGLKELQGLEQIFSSDKTKKDKFEVTLGFPPSISFNFSVPFGRKKHLIFLRNIHDRAIERIREPSFIDWYRAAYERR